MRDLGESLVRKHGGRDQAPTLIESTPLKPRVADEANTFRMRNERGVIYPFNGGCRCAVFMHIVPQNLLDGRVTGRHCRFLPCAITRSLVPLPACDCVRRLAARIRTAARLREAVRV